MASTLRIVIAHRNPLPHQPSRIEGAAIFGQPATRHDGITVDHLNALPAPHRDRWVGIIKLKALMASANLLKHWPGQFAHNPTTDT